MVPIVRKPHGKEALYYVTYLPNPQQEGQSLDVQVRVAQWNLNGEMEVKLLQGKVRERHLMM